MSNSPLSTRPALTQPQSLVALGGVLLSVATGAAIGSGNLRPAVLIASGLTLAALAWFMGSRLMASPGKLGYWLLAGAFFAMPLNALRVTGSVTMGDFILLAALPFAAVAVISRSAKFSVPTWIYIGGGLLIVSILIVEVFPPGGIQQVALTPTTLLQQRSDVDESSNLLSGLRLIVALVLLPLVTAALANSWSRIRVLANAWIAGVAFSCFVAVVGALLGVDFLQVNSDLPIVGTGLYEGDRAIGLSVHPVTFALTVAMAAPLVLTRITDRRSGFVYGTLFVLFVVAVLLSGSRSGLLVLLAVCALVLLSNPRTRRVVGVALIAGVIFLIVLLLSTPIPGTERFGGDEVSVSQSDRSRLLLYEESIGYIVERPITGNGFELVRDSHNLTLQLLVAGGLIALVGFYTILLGFLAMGWKLRLRVPDAFTGDALGLTLALVAFLLVGLVGNDIYARYLYIPAGLILAMGLVATSDRDHISGQGNGSSGPLGGPDTPRVRWTNA